MRKIGLLVAVLTMAVVLAGLVSGCGGGDDDDVATATTDDTEPESTTTTTEVTAGVALALGDVAVASTGPETALDDATKAAILAASQKFVDTAGRVERFSKKFGGTYSFQKSAAAPAAAAGAKK